MALFISSQDRQTQVSQVQAGDAIHAHAMATIITIA